MDVFLKNYLEDILFAVALFLGLGTITIFPSYNLAIAERIPVPIEISGLKTSNTSSLPTPGYSLIFQNVPQNIQIMFDNQPLAKIANHPNNYFAGFGRHEKKLVPATFYFQKSNQSNLIKEKITLSSIKFWQHPKTSYAFKILPSNSPYHHTKIKKANKLRLPASVWKKVNKTSNADKTYKEKLKWAHRSYRDFPLETCWQSPLDKKHINSKYGRPRTLPNGVTYYHSGVDLRARTGTPLRAPANGRVAIAEHSTVPGNTVVIYHGGGVHSQLMHLSKIQVKPGQLVKKGEIVGLSGSSGRVEGPHLHWEIHWNSKKLNPFPFVHALSDYCEQG